MRNTYRPAATPILALLAVLLSACGSGGGGGGEIRGDSPTRSFPARQAAGAPDFSPCPRDGACRILPLGDSITFGTGAADGGGYRVELFSRAVRDGKRITFVGSQKNGPERVADHPFPRNHDGYVGETINGLTARIPGQVTLQDAHIVLLHAGTNDLNLSPSGAARRFGNLLDTVTRHRPDALVVVARVIPIQLSSRSMTLAEEYNESLAAVVQNRAAAGRKVILADHFTGYPANTMPDGVHPDSAGYAFMAGVWYGAISPYLR